MNGSPYKGLAPFAEPDGPLFFGRERECRLVKANLLSAPLTILFGPSGVGKSSLLRAGLIFNLHRDAKDAAVLFDRWQSADPATELRNTVVDELKRVSPEMVIAPEAPLDELLTLPGAPPIYVLCDQFERYLQSHSTEAAAQAFEATFARSINRASGNARFLISIREDLLARLDRFEGRIPNLFDNYFRLEHLDRAAAREAIVGPLRVYNEHANGRGPVAIEPELVDVIVDQVAAGRLSLADDERLPLATAQPVEERVEAPYLQLVLLRLWQTTEDQRAPRTLRTSTLNALGGAQQIVRTHLDTVMSALKPRQRIVSARILRFLAPLSGGKVAYTPRDLAAYAELPVSAVEDVLERLSSSDFRVTRAVAPAVEHGPPRYEVFHDVLLPAVLAWHTRFLARTTWSRNLIFAAFALLLLATGVQVAIDLPEPVRLVLRWISIATVDAIALLQIHRRFIRYVGSASSSLGLAAYRGPDLGALLGLLFTLLWLVETRWDTPTLPSASLGSVTIDVYLQYMLIVGMLTLFFGFITFFVMVNAGYLTQRLFNSFDVGFYAAYVVACVLAAALALAVLVGVLPRFLSLAI
jgi:hypothetical protein